jgi:hypothetical protein
MMGWKEARARTATAHGANQSLDETWSHRDVKLSAGTGAGGREAQNASK